MAKVASTQVGSPPIAVTTLFLAPGSLSFNHKVIKPMFFLRAFQLNKAGTILTLEDGVRNTQLECLQSRVRNTLIDISQY